MDHFAGLDGGAVRRNSESVVSSLSSSTFPSVSKRPLVEEVDADEKNRLAQSTDSEGSQKKEDIDLNYRLSSQNYLSPAKEKILFNLLFQASTYRAGSTVSFNQRIPTRTTSPKDKRHEDFADKIHMTQKLSFHEGPIWTMKFSHSGNYLCTAGQDTRVVLWSFSQKKDDEKVLQNHFESF